MGFGGTDVRESAKSLQKSISEMSAERSWIALKLESGPRRASAEVRLFRKADILPDPNRVGEELFWAQGEFVSRQASETSLAVLLNRATMVCLPHHSTDCPPLGESQRSSASDFPEANFLARL